MSRLAPDDNFYSSGPSRRYYNNRDDDGGSQMYDDYPRSRSQSADRRRGSPGAMRSSPHGNETMLDYGDVAGFGGFSCVMS